MRSRALAKLWPRYCQSFIATRATTARAFPYSDFFTPANPQHLSLTLFASAIGNESRYAATHEGFQLEQTLNPYIGVVGRVSGYQIYQGAGWDNPLHGSSGDSTARLRSLHGRDRSDAVPGNFAGYPGRPRRRRQQRRENRGRLFQLDTASQPPSNQCVLHRRSLLQQRTKRGHDRCARGDVVMAGVTWLLGAGGQFWGGGQSRMS